MNKRQKKKILKRKQKIEQMVSMAETLETRTGLLVKAAEGVQKNIAECIKAISASLNAFMQEVRTMPDERFEEMIQDENLNEAQRGTLKIIRLGRKQDGDSQ